MTTRFFLLLVYQPRLCFFSSNLSKFFMFFCQPHPTMCAESINLKTWANWQNVQEWPGWPDGGRLPSTFFQVWFDNYNLIRLSRMPIFFFQRPDALVASPLLLLLLLPLLLLLLRRNTLPRIHRPDCVTKPIGTKRHLCSKSSTFKTFKITEQTLQYQ